STSVPEFNDGSSDFFSRTDGSDFDSYAVTGADGDFYFAGQDLDSEGADLPITLNIENINIAGYTAMEFKVLLASYLNGWDNSDYVRFYYKIDGGEPQNLLWLANAGTGSNTPAYIDLNFDGIGDCTELNSAFQEFTAPIEGEGSFLEIYAEFSLDSGGEDIVLDNIQLDGIFQGGGNDDEDPVASCVESNTLVVELDENGEAQIEAADINDGSSDNVGIQSLEINQTEFTCADLGEVEITLTVTDLSDNTDQCTTTIEVVDLIVPEVSADGLVEVSLDENGEAAITEATFNGSATDNCGSITTEISPSTLTCADITTETNFANDLIISEYLEGSENNKYIEIFNGTGEAKDLNDYSLKFYFNELQWQRRSGIGKRPHRRDTRHFRRNRGRPRFAMER
ncbi:MAG: lamin tail domain-containing protein, partial [Flavobacteriales bacterium]|nr:lamin tail domain-containing protein [Flavobacteriales bacterium]